MKKPFHLPFLLSLLTLLLSCSGTAQPTISAPAATIPTPILVISPTAAPSVTPSKPSVTLVPTPTFNAGAPSSTPRVSRCRPTHADDLSPTYKPNAPVRNIVGKGHVVTGIVRSGLDCAPIAYAMLEFWPELAGQGHPDEMRSTFYPGADGSYRFESVRPEHIHMRISAAGYRTIANNQYHPEGQLVGTFDIVLEPLAP